MSEVGNTRAGTPDGGVRRYLIVANQTLGGPQLPDAVQECLERGPAQFYLVVPATPVSHGLVWTEGEAHLLARRRLTRALRCLSDLGVDAGGEVGDADPILAITDVLLQRDIDEILLFTLPPGLSRWLHQDLPQRVGRRFGLPLRHVPAPAERIAAEPDREATRRLTG
jgi:GABA permease